MSMRLGQQLRAKTSGALYELEEIHPDGTRAIARSTRTGGRVMVYDEPDRFVFRLVEDNGQPGASLFDSLIPTGPRRGMWSPAWTTIEALITG